MNIPAKFQVFGHFIQITALQQKEMTPILSNWMKLHSRMGNFRNETLQRFVILELMGRARPFIIHRLVQRITTTHREQIRERIAQLKSR